MSYNFFYPLGQKYKRGVIQQVFSPKKENGTWLDCFIVVAIFSYKKLTIVSLRFRGYTILDSKTD